MPTPSPSPSLIDAAGMPAPTQRRVRTQRAKCYVIYSCSLHRAARGAGETDRAGHSPKKSTATPHFYGNARLR